MADAELIVIFIDNSFAACESIRDQYAAVEHYCETKLAANSETEVTVFTMGSADFRCLLFPPTGSIVEVSDSLKSICFGAGSLCLQEAIYFAFPFFCANLGIKKKRMLFLVGGLVDMSQKHAERYGSCLKKLDIAVDVVNFYLGKTPQDTSINRYGRMELDAFVNAAKSDDNSHIEHVQPGSNIREVLSKFILKKTLHDSMINTNRHEKAKRKNHSPVSRKTKRHKRAEGKNHSTLSRKRKRQADGDNEHKRKRQADGDNEHVQTEALSISSGQVGQGEANSAV